ncbi:TrmB family transcriptional regulator [Promicromonospora thailandica]|uniref:Regulatory protein, luxR family n=1 Tax=Promicromonospora thailandica TaxID=765201 RepID=A0A9X2GBY6_9MICO|nr:LuxR C-terminal-related transcriptional regulator [Promicromonospora thailandica]MCP2266964.1 regulatory protein, luxR family [Promicromonospora thailandica]
MAPEPQLDPVLEPTPEPGSDFRAVGIDDDTRLVYRYVLAQGTVRVADVARDVPLAGTDAGAMLARLRAAGLINRTAGNEGEYTAVDPRVALRALTDRTAARLDRVRATIPDLAGLFEQTADTAGPGGGVHVIDDPALIGAWYTRLEHEVTAEFMAFDRPPYVLASENPVEPLVLERGVVWRAVYAAEVLDRPGAWAEIRHAAAAGEQARVARSLPTKLAIADRRTALVSSDLDPRRPAAVVVEGGPLVDLLCAAFEAVWADAVEIPAADDLAGAAAPDRGPGKDDRALLALLASGAKDEAIARELGLSERTLRRRTTDLLRRLGAANRFQAGVQAVRRGWL